MNIKLLRQIQEAILAEPEHYNQNKFCGTAHCIAGWAVALSNPLTFKELSNTLNAPRIASEAKKLLKLDDMTYFNLCSFVCDWPKKFFSSYLKAKTPKARAQVAVERIDYFIKTGGQ